MSMRNKFLDFVHKNCNYKLFELSYKSFDCINHIKYISQNTISKKNNNSIGNFKNVKLDLINLENRIIFPCYIPNGEFKETTMKFMSNPNLKIAVLETDHGFYVQPRETYYKLQFEELFGFGSGCLGFDKNRTIFIPFDYK
jgi:hypothetical protein